MFSTSGGYHEYIKGISEYIRGCSVHWGNTMGRSGDIMITLGGVQYIWRIPRVHQGTLSVHQGIFSTSRDIKMHVGEQGDKAFPFLLKTLMY